MNQMELEIKELIISKYGSLKNFSETINMPWSTLDSILKRGFANSNITNVLKITKELQIDSESLVEGTIVFINNNPPSTSVDTLAAHFDGDEYTPEELEEINKFAEFVKNKRK